MLSDEERAIDVDDWRPNDWTPRCVCGPAGKLGLRGTWSPYCPVHPQPDRTVADIARVPDGIVPDQRYVPFVEDDPRVQNLRDACDL